MNVNEEAKDVEEHKSEEEVKAGQGEPNQDSTNAISNDQSDIGTIIQEVGE